MVVAEGHPQPLSLTSCMHPTQQVEKEAKIRTTNAKSNNTQLKGKVSRFKVHAATIKKTLAAK